MAAKAIRDAERAAEEEAVRKAEEAEQAAAEEVAEAGFMESPELLAEAKLANAAEAASHDVIMKAQVDEMLEKPDNEKTAEEIVADRIAEEAHLHELMEKKYALPEADFALDYSEWQINYEDGTSKVFDYNSSELAKEA
jgi:choline dehydrogenase-like flavoprotein